MNLEVSTINVLLALGIGLQVWIVKSLLRLERSLVWIRAHCRHCQENPESDEKL